MEDFIFKLRNIVKNRTIKNLNFSNRRIIIKLNP